MNIEIECCDRSLLSQLLLEISGVVFCYSPSEIQCYFKIWPFSKDTRDSDSKMSLVFKNENGIMHSWKIQKKELFLIE